MNHSLNNTESQELTQTITGLYVLTPITVIFQGDVAKMSQLTAIDFFIPLFVPPGRFVQQTPVIKSACAIHMPSRYTRNSVITSCNY